MENTQDRYKHGTINHGSRNGAAKLTEEQVRQILSLKGKTTQTEVSHQFGVGPQAIGKIWNGKRWSEAARELTSYGP